MPGPVVTTSPPHLNAITDVQMDFFTDREKAALLKDAFKVGLYDGLNDLEDKFFRDGGLDPDYAQAYSVGRLQGWKKKHPSNMPPAELLIAAMGMQRHADKERAAA